jgi:stearoyl-CoA desaturase (delta-9 desaturase)
VLWWAANHRHHHRYSDQPEDIHSPTLSGFWWAHVGWVVSSRYDRTRYELIPDLAKFPELRWLNRHPFVPPVVFGTIVYVAGGWPALYWGFLLALVLLWHGSFTVNSLAHTWGWRRYRTHDTSRNNVWLALLTLGEGWHNNHHHYQASARQGFYWWEVDFSYYLLKVWQWLGLIWDVITPPQKVLGMAREEGRT